VLVLTRKAGQSIMIGDGIEVRIVQVKGTGDQASVKIGVSAPEAVRVLRKEVFDEVAAENRRAALEHVGSVDELERLAQIRQR